MFIIVPKQSKRVETSNKQSPSQASDGNEHQGDRGPVRTTIACDSCRIKKTKCNGQQPCSLCQRKRIICVFSRPGNQRDLPASESRTRLFQHQQRRLCAALQQMATIIAKHESVSASRSSDGTFDVLELLDEYAPQHMIDDDGPVPILLEDETGSRKRRRDDTNATLEAHPDVGTADELRGSEHLFEVQPTEHFLASSEDSSAAYQSMMQFIRSMGSGRQVQPSTDETISNQPPVHASLGPATTSQGVAIPHMATDTQSLQSVDTMQQWTDLVDWDTSLQNLQDSQDLFFSPGDSFPTMLSNSELDATMTDSQSSR